MQSACYVQCTVPCLPPPALVPLTVQVSEPRERCSGSLCCLAAPGLLFGPVEAAGAECAFPAGPAGGSVGGAGPWGSLFSRLLPRACSSLMVLLEGGGRYFPGPPVLLG